MKGKSMFPLEAEKLMFTAAVISETPTIDEIRDLVNAAAEFRAYLAKAREESKMFDTKGVKRHAR